jgi:hypothetical protein
MVRVQKTRSVDRRSAAKRSCAPKDIDAYLAGFTVRRQPRGGTGPSWTGTKRL